jgi:hypothetical protein
MADDKKKINRTRRQKGDGSFEEVFTAKDSAMFKAYEKYMEDHIEADTTMFNPSFMDKYNIYSQKPAEEVRADSAITSKFEYAEQREDSDWIFKNEDVIKSLNNMYSKDYSAFQSDSAKFKKLGKLQRDQKALWEAREGEISWWNPNWVFNTYDKDSKLGILSREMMETGKEKRSLYDRWFTEGLPLTTGSDSIEHQPSGKGRLDYRKGQLDKLNEELKTRKARFNKTTYEELDKKGY